MSGERDQAELGAMALYASALAGTALPLHWHTEPHGLTYCDGRAVFVARSRAEHALLDVTLQSLLVREGSLRPRAMRNLIGRSARARAYLGLELARALRAHAAWLPNALLAHEAVRALPGPSRDLDDSLARAQHGELARTPAAWGLLLPARVLARSRAPSSAVKAGSEPSPEEVLRQRERADRELEHSTILDAFRAPIESSMGLFSRMLNQIIDAQRSSADRAPAGRGGFGEGEARETDALAESARVIGDATGRDAPAVLQATRDFCYPEWHEGRQRYRPRFVRVAEVAPDASAEPGAALEPPAAVRALCRTLSGLCFGYDPHSHQALGDDVQVDALVRLRADVRSGHAADPRIYRANLRTRRELGVLVLLDVTGSTAERAPDGVRVFDRQLGFALSLVQALHALGDRVALYGFHSWGPKIVRMPRLLAFGERPGAQLRERARLIAPVGYSRLGAAVRHASAVLRDRAGTPHRLLVVISDALAYDKGYEHSYAQADCRRALAEARAGNTACVCLSIGASTDAAALARVFGGTCYLALPELHGGERALRALFERAVAAVSRRHLGLSATAST